MTLTTEQAGRLHAILVEALSIMDSVPYMPTETCPPTEPGGCIDGTGDSCGCPGEHRVRKPTADDPTMDQRILSALTTTPVPLAALDDLTYSRSQLQRAMQRLRQAGRVVVTGQKKGTKYALAAD